ncbi:hypothetical protein FB451DRAFT_1551434 [Mycena latifolia]|nr:hypothetical protein FB451DRAFT_1551434 [Mycena latifolia]
MSCLSGTSLSFLASAPPTSTTTNILLGVLICAAAVHNFHCASPMRLTHVLVTAIAATEKTISKPSKPCCPSLSDTDTAATLTRYYLQIKVSIIRETTLRDSLSYRTSFDAFFQGRTLIVLHCIHDVRGLETYIEARLHPSARRVLVY